MGWCYHSTSSISNEKTKDQTKIFSPMSLIISFWRNLSALRWRSSSVLICLIAFWLSGCAGCATAIRPVYFTSEPRGAMITVPRERGDKPGRTPCSLKMSITEPKPMLLLPSIDRSEVRLEGCGIGYDGGDRSCKADGISGDAHAQAHFRSGGGSIHNLPPSGCTFAHGRGCRYVVC